MSFDPAKPANHSPLVSQVIRDQFIALFQLTQSIPAGPQGPQGDPGQPFAQAVVDAVNTLNPGENATVSVSFDGTNVHFTLGIPRGADGSNGTDGVNGEVTNTQLNAALNSTSNNTNGVSTLDTPFVDADVEALRVAFNALVLAARR